MEDVPLLPTAPAAFLAALFSSVHGGTVPFPPRTVAESRFGPAPHADPRYALFFGHRAMVAAANWGGAARVLAECGDPHRAGFGRAMGLGETAARLEARLYAVLDAELERFWGPLGAEGAPAFPGAAPLQTIENLAIVWALAVAAAVADFQLSRKDAVRSLAAQALDVLRAAGVPRHRPPGEPGWGLDDLTFVGYSIAAHWAVAVLDYSASVATGRPPVVDTPREAPDVPANVPAVWLGAIPPPSERPPNGPIPAHFLLPSFSGITARSYLGWICPELSPPVPADVRDRILLTHVRPVGQVGPAFAAHMTLYAAAKVAAYRRWLADCGLGVADVAFVGTLGAPRKPGDLRFEAARRRDHLLGAIGALLGAMPEGLAAAAEAGTFAGVEAALPGFDDAQRLGLLGHVIGLRHLALSLLVPDASDDAPSLASAEPPAWFRTRSFALALSHARSMSLVANLLAERPAHLAASLFAAPTCRASAAAGWLHLLCLRLAPADPLPEGYSPSASLAACLRAIESSALPPAQPAHLLLSRLADPCSPPPARSDLAALAVNSWGCVHLLPSQRTAAGACWACLSGAPPDPAAHLPDQGDPMASLPRRGSDVSAGVTRAGSESSGSVGGSGRAGSVGLLGRRGSDARRVRFHPDVYVFRAHSRESYPRAGGDGAGAAG